MQRYKLYTGCVNIREFLNITILFTLNAVLTALKKNCIARTYTYCIGTKSFRNRGTPGDDDGPFGHDGGYNIGIRYNDVIILCARSMLARPRYRTRRGPAHSFGRPTAYKRIK